MTPISARARHGQAGFTLLELLAALVASLFVVMAAMMLSRGATRLFASEDRMGAAQLSARLGADQLRADLQRAGFMSSANIVGDPDTCPDPNNSAGVKIASRIQSLFYVQGTAATAAISAPISADTHNQLYPDSLFITGNFLTSDSYLVADMEPQAAGWVVNLQRNNGAMQRLLAASSLEGTLAYFQRIFPANSVLRLTNELGSSQYVIVASVAVSPVNGTPQLTLKTTPSVLVATGTSQRCGITGLCMGCTINPVKTYGYTVRSKAADTNFAWAYVPSTDPSANDSTNAKYDLVRAEYTPMPADVATAMTPIAGSESIVAEYVADLKFAFNVDTAAAPTVVTPWVQPTVVAYAFGDATASGYVSDVTSNAASKPQRVRSVRFRLSTRSKEIDRSQPLVLGVAPATVTNPTLAPAGTPMRYWVGTVGGTDEYTRVRTIQSEVVMGNQQGSRW